MPQQQRTNDSISSIPTLTMQTLESQVRSLRHQVESTETQLRNLKQQLQRAEQRCEAARHVEQAWAGGMPQDWITETLAALSPEAQQAAGRTKTTHGRWPLESEEYKRYGRQMILPEVGLHGQLRLKNAKVLLVGVGGLGCPAAAYLAGAGVGTIGLMDGDTVEISNLHRQVAHGTERVGMSKVDSAVEYLTSYVSVPTVYLKNQIITSSNTLPSNTKLHTALTQTQPTPATPTTSPPKPLSKPSQPTTSFSTAPTIQPPATLSPTPAS
jgi:adenylyltransferase/sulfurtransferase